MSNVHGQARADRLRLAVKTLLFSTISYLALANSDARAQEIEDLPAVVVDTSEPPKARKKTANRTNTRLTVPEDKSKVGTTSTSSTSGAAASSVPSSSVPGSSATSQPDGNTGGPVKSGGVTGASTSIITREQIDRAAQSTLADIISREAGAQTSGLFGGVNGAKTTVDLRGFGVTGPSNTLILINGRRQNDWDLPGFDLSTIAKDSIERIEITRGNSGGVLYGDGAVGGVINIVTRTGVATPNQVKIDGGVGSFNTKEGNVSASGSSGPFSAFVNGNVIESDGYRDNNKLEQTSVVGDFRWMFTNGSVYLNVAADEQRLGLPGPRTLTELINDPRGTNSPRDNSEKDGARITLGASYQITPNVELILDGGVRKKEDTAEYLQFTGFESYLDTTLTTASFTPRANLTTPFLSLPSRIVAGIDVFDTDYDSDRSQLQGLNPIHRYAGGQTTVAGYWQQTVSVTPATDVSAGGRIQWNRTTASDVYDPTAPGAGFANPQGLPLDQNETNHAWHVGVEHQLVPGLTLLGRAAQSFRVPNIDERIGSSPLFQVTDFDLETQKSQDWEVGLRLQYGPLGLQSTYYEMRITDELRFDPINFVNTNLDPTLRRGVETIASLQLTPDVRLRGNLTYINAEFEEGPFAGNQVPLVSPWSGSAGVTWNILGPQLWLDANLRYFSQRYLDGNEINANAQYFVPSTALVDVKIGGEFDRLEWSAAVQNLFDEDYYDYGLDAGFGFYSFYPQPGRTFMIKAGTKW
ncbi:MAG: hypothetical protein B7Y80_08265 [Hyphomicrobium sp. 32-62-53]|nr:MAG: hypothetical protein B7Z29_16215 [Hyphomicrobium sp. 12-62-95]OYY00130.1 MAG: hypothetical protein B7Y80_08265 [Hyphomicrobium sp. 32-62-53]